MMRSFHWIIIALSLNACAHTSPYALSSIPYSEENLKKAERGPASTYLSLDLPFASFEKLRKEVENRENISLRHRGEAHITVITPPEMTRLYKKITQKEVQRLADEMGLAQSPYKLLCVGKGSVKENSTYYVVVQSDRLFEIRRAVQSLYISKGGKAQDFLAEVYYPHVTLGYTHRDLHFEEGVTKDASTCIYLLRPEDKYKN